jgi:hypothetical protein
MASTPAPVEGDGQDSPGNGRDSSPADRRAELSAPDLPPPDTRSFDVEVEPALLESVRERLGAQELAPGSEAALLRYLVYLGAAYLEAESVAARSGDVGRAFERLHREYAAVGGEAAVLRYHYSEEARMHAAEQRAEAAHERSAGAYLALLERMRAEVATREERVRRLEEARRR